MLSKRTKIIITIAISLAISGITVMFVGCSLIDSFFLWFIGLIMTIISFVFMTVAQFGMIEDGHQARMKILKDNHQARMKNNR